MEITISFGGYSLPKTNREGRGKSIIAFPDNYCVVDIETTGLSPEWDDIIEIGAIRYTKREETARFQTLVQPPSGPHIPAFIEDFTGITSEMLKDAPKTEKAIQEFSIFLGNDVIVGYNVSFDVNFLYDCFVRYLGRPLSNDFIDIMRLSRKLYPELAHHRLIDMTEKFNVPYDQAHRAVSDVLATEACYVRMHTEALEKCGSEEAFINLFKKNYAKYVLKASDIQSDASKQDPDSPLYGQHCVFTGKLEKFTRKEAMQIVADLGGINEDGVTRKTNFLILGNNDYCTTIKDGKSSKQKKAEQSKLKGQDIEIITETVFYDMLGDLID